METKNKMEIKNNKALNAFISKTILKNLGPSGMDFKEIFLFAICMQMIILKSCFSVQSKARQGIDEILSYWINIKNTSKKAEQEITNEQLGKLYTANRARIMKIYNEVWNNCTADSGWIKEWEQVCIKASKKNNSPFENCIELIDALNVHLEFSYNGLIINLYLIKKMLQVS